MLMVRIGTNGKDGAKGDEGLGIWRSSTSTSTSTTSISLSSITIPSGRSVKVGDLIIANSTYSYLYRVTAVSSTTATVSYITSLRGATGPQGPAEPTGTTIYSNSSGTTGTVSLNKNASNFSLMEIYYNKEGLNTSCKVCDPNGKSATLMFSQFTSDKVYQGASKKITISGTNISVSTYQSGFGNIIDGATDDVTQGQENAIYITKVIGYVS